MQNKNIIITGTSRGIGYEMALQFANAGHQVLAISRKTPQILMEHENITCLPIDISDENQLLQVGEFVSKTWKKVDVLIHNAGSLLHKNFTEITTQEFQNIYKDKYFFSIYQIILQISFENF
jgi:short-subunit dehydrogenase